MLQCTVILMFRQAVAGLRAHWARTPRTCAATGRWARR